jgi:hypothetical protein
LPNEKRRFHLRHPTTQVALEGADIESMRGEDVDRLAWGHCATLYSWTAILLRGSMPDTDSWANHQSASDVVRCPDAAAEQV